MALLDDCFFCSLSVAASVIGVYTLVAYVIAFFMETWWIVNTPVTLPSPAYVLCAGYLLVSIFSGILLRGLSIKNTLFLLEWLLVVAVLTVPEGVLVYFMSIHYWNIRSLYGLMELTCWICRAVVNVSGIICVQSLYSTWREEKEVIRRLRDLNMTRVIPNRRNSVVSQSNGLKPGPAPGTVFNTPQPQVLNNGTLRRTGSMVSVLSRPQNAQAMFLTPMPLHHPLDMTVDMGMNMFKTSEFNASQFDLSLQQVTQVTRVEQTQGVSKAHSLMDLRLSGPGSVTGDTPRKTMSVIDFPLEEKRSPQTQSLDRRILRHNPYTRHFPIAPQVEAFYVSGRLMNAYYPPFPNGHVGFMNTSDMYGRNINAFHPAKMKSRSKHSVGSESDDFQKYRDIAL